MTKVIIIINMIIKFIWFKLINKITNHLGRNPKKGGNPPKDRILIENLK